MLAREGALIAGKLRLERPLASGGMGAVWVARHLLLDTDVAVKFINAEGDAPGSLRARFLQEAKASLRIKSPHVVQVLDYGVEEGTPFMVMELLEGEDLRAHLERAGRLSLEATYQLLAPLGRALRRAHSIGLVHRDLKPSNIFLARCGDEVIVKVLDFGIAKQVQEQPPSAMTTSSVIIGSPRYMSPEQVRAAKQLDHRSDLWSMGVIVYEALTGRTPFEDDTLGGLIIAICAEPWPLPSALVPALGAGVDRFMARALERDPAARFQSADEMVDAFATLVGARPPMRSESALLRGEKSDAPVDPTASTAPQDGIAARHDGAGPAPAAAPEVAPAATPEVAPAAAPEVAPAAAPEVAPAAAPEVAPRAPADDTTLAALATRAPKKKRAWGKLAGLLAAGATGMAAAAALELRAERSTGEPTAAAVPAASAPAPAAAPAPPALTSPAARDAPVPVRLAIEPPGAIVKVDGRAVAVDGGAVEIHGTIGSTHVVDVQKDGRRMTRAVVVEASGAVPDRLVLAAPAPGRADAPTRRAGSAQRDGAPAPAQASAHADRSASPARAAASAPAAAPLEPDLNRQFE
ncbi:serine/threonine-protein kinase [Sorangium sp. So ce1182]|uniref:serine/threonine-protein kinase n=1 Tax=Sorangium sp. So ce1182 TaxID=3133334 RepID=UPI003F61E382